MQTYSYAIVEAGGTHIATGILLRDLKRFGAEGYHVVSVVQQQSGAVTPYLILEKPNEAQ